MSKSIPDVNTLLDAAVQYLEQGLLPSLSGYHRFQTRVTVNVLNIIRRELENRASQESAERDRLIAIGDFGEYRPDVRVDHDAWRTRRDRLRQQWNYGKAIGGRMRLLVRRDRDRVRPMVKRVLWKRGIKLALRRAREGWWEGAVLSALRTGGVVAGFVVAVPRLRRPWPAPSDETAG